MTEVSDRFQQHEHSNFRSRFDLFEMFLEVKKPSNKRIKTTSYKKNIVLPMLLFLFGVTQPLHAQSDYYMRQARSGEMGLGRTKHFISKI